MYTAHSGHILIHIARPIPCVILVQLGESSNEISLTFVFETTVTYGVIIPGNYSEMHWGIAIDLVMPQAKFHVGGVSLTMILGVICKIESVFRPTNVH